MATYYVFVGIPGSGKSHLAAQLAAATGAIIVCPDEIRQSHRVRSERAFEIAREEIATNLMAGRDVILDATNTLRKWRQANIMAGKEQAERVVAVLMATPLELCLDRQSRRAAQPCTILYRAQGEKESLPNGVIRRMAEQLADNPPLLEEGFDEILVFSGIVMTLTSGELAGRSRQLFLDQVDPMDMLSSCVQHGDHWNIDYSSATPEEQFQWLRADLVCRAILAQQEGRPVFFEGQEFADLQAWEDTIADSGQMVTIDRDDETGYWVVGVGPEPRTIRFGAEPLSPTLH